MHPGNNHIAELIKRRAGSLSGSLTVHFWSWFDSVRFCSILALNFRSNSVLSTSAIHNALPSSTDAVTRKLSIACNDYNNQNNSQQKQQRMFNLSPHIHIRVSIIIVCSIVSNRCVRLKGSRDINNNINHFK